MHSRTIPIVFDALPRRHYGIRRLLLRIVIAGIGALSIIWVIFAILPSRNSSAIKAGPVIATFNNPNCAGTPNIQPLMPNFTEMAPSSKCRRVLGQLVSWQCIKPQGPSDALTLRLNSYEGQPDCHGAPTRIDSWATGVCIPAGGTSQIYACADSDLTSFDSAASKSIPSLHPDLDPEYDCQENECPMGHPERAIFSAQGCWGRPLYKSLPFGRNELGQCYNAPENGSNWRMQCEDHQVRIDHSFNGCFADDFVWRREIYTLDRCFRMETSSHSYSYSCRPRPTEEYFPPIAIAYDDEVEEGQ